MLRKLIAASLVLATLSGCARLAESRINPFNWFGRSTETAAPATPVATRPLVPEGRVVQVVDGRQLVSSVTALSVDRSPTGAIVRATGITPTQGYFNAELVNRGVENGVLTLEFRAEGPNGFEAAGTERSRQITSAYLIDNSILSGIRSVRVVGATNARTARR